MCKSLCKNLHASFFRGNLPYCTQIYARVSAAMPVVCTVQGFSENIAVAETNYQINVRSLPCCDGEWAYPPSIK